MATLGITIGTLTSTITAINQNAANVLLNVWRIHHPGIDPSSVGNQEKLDWIVQSHIPTMLTGESRQYKEQVAVSEFIANFNVGDEKFE